MIASAGVLCACASTVTGSPVVDESVGAAPSSSGRPIPGPPPGVPADEQPGVVPTTGAAPAGCAVEDPPPVGVTASVDDPDAPTITVALPSGWSTSAGDGDVGARLTGPDGESATVTIERTSLDPGDAFQQYADDALEASTVSSISVLPGALCGFSGQKLLGSWSEPPQQAVTFGDRIAHIPARGADYLVAVHVEAPARGTFDPLTSPLLADFAVAIP